MWMLLVARLAMAQPAEQETSTGVEEAPREITDLHAKAALHTAAVIASQSTWLLVTGWAAERQRQRSFDPDFYWPPVGLLLAFGSMPGFIAAGAALSVGTILLVTRPRRGKKVTVGPMLGEMSGFVVQGRFR